MSWIRFCSALVATLGLTTAAEADLMHLLGGQGGHGSCKSCGCDSTCQPECCKPTITRPCDVTVNTYQRGCPEIKPACCDTVDAPQGCAPADCSCNACGCDPCACDPCACDSGGGLFDLFGGHKSCLSGGGLFSGHHSQPSQCCGQCQTTSCGCETQACGCETQACGCETQACGCESRSCGCEAPAHGGCGCSLGGGGGLFGGGCLLGGGGNQCCDADPCEIANLIYTAQTACYADDRKSAIDDLGDYDCFCNPEIMTAMIYALNDADENVRAEAADEIGDLIRDGRCCCSEELTAALTAALGDCDDDVRGQAEEALEACGYEIVDGCCGGCGCGACGTTTAGCGCNGGNGTMTNGEPTPAPMPENGEAAPAPAPPEDPEAYFPSRLHRQASKSSRGKSRLANLFGLLD